MYHDLLTRQGFNYRVVKGTGHERLLNAIRFVDEYLLSIDNPQI
jgi:hypothetical protein